MLQSYLRRFEERKNGIGAPTFDESTVAKWSRDLLPVLENHVLEQFKPARRVAEGKVIQRVVSREVLADPTMSERSILAEYVDLCEHGRLSIYHGIALAALNDYDQRIGNERRFFQTQQRTALIACALFLVMVVLLIGSNTAMMPLRGELLRFAGFISGICGVVLFVLMLAKVWVSTTMAAEHITKTRTDIQTLRQLADEVNEGSSS